MAQTAPPMHSPSAHPSRPRGILKNPSYQQPASPDARISPTSDRAPSSLNDVTATDGTRPIMPARELSEKEIVQMNTEMNAGAARRNSANHLGSTSRRQSNQTNGVDGEQESGQRLKWDEANLYLNEGQMGGKMKIDEPKTPYAKQYDPTEDEDELNAIDPKDLAVDELDMEKSKSARKARESDIPGLDLGEPELDLQRQESDSDKRVSVDSDYMDVDGGRHGEEVEENMSHEELEKHRKFEQMRKKHYEMKNIKNLLGHSAEELDDIDNDQEMNGDA
ncbi:Hypothetical protein R9X50_00673300 [Acrodontium crateriforme]|uniref:Glc8 protein n=1 Tax=Acrodontium crateriforme TaxID=150365 RepID=A0AAQ3M9P1_9PEZI|nr:Hypothetical protein R9X50_00673300 [Acrodontium crateriforme]